MLGYTFKRNDLEPFQTHLQDLKDRLDAEDFLELDWFLYQITQNMDLITVKVNMTTTL